MTLEDALLNLLDACQPAQLIHSGELAGRLVHLWQQEHPALSMQTLPDDLSTLSFPLDRLYDLALFTRTLDDLPARDAALLLGQMRNCGARQIAVLISDSAALDFRALIGLGFSRQAWPEKTSGVCLYTYDIASYNHKRSWNNAKHWANPENWGKYWW